jgi:hypothetical protein
MMHGIPHSLFMTVVRQAVGRLIGFLFPQPTCKISPQQQSASSTLPNQPNPKTQYRKWRRRSGLHGFGQRKRQRRRERAINHRGLGFSVDLFWE